MEKEKRTTDSILSALKEIVEAKRVMNPELWIEAAFDLNLLLGDEHLLLENMRSEVASKKLEILKSQEKKNATIAKIEIEASDEYRFFKLQEHKVLRVEEFIKIAKASARSGFGT